MLLTLTTQSAFYSLKVSYMKKILLLAAMACLSMGMQAAQPFVKGKTRPWQTTKPAKMKKGVFSMFPRAIEEQTLLNEDFAQFSAGTEDAPGAEIVYDNTYYIPESMTAQPGWTGQGVRPAGGCVALYPWETGYEDEPTRGGYISTPPLLLDGTATLTFRAKVIGAAEGELWVALCDDYYGPGNDQEDFVLTGEWQEFTLVATDGAMDENSYFQMMSTGEGYALVDDVKLTFKRDRIATPYALPAENISATEFNARWEPVDNAKNYLLTLLCTEAPKQIVTGEIAQGFDGIKVQADGKTIDNAAPNYPEGWYVNVSEAGSQDVTTEAGNYSSGPLALVFDAVGDTIVSPVTPETIDEFSFWCKPTGNTEEDYMSMSLIRVEIYHSATDKWENVAQLAYYSFGTDGSVYSFNKEMFTNDVNRVRLTLVQRGNLSFYLDDLKLHYSSRGKNVTVFEDKVVEGTSYNVKDIDPANEYSYYVKAQNDELVSGASYMTWVDGIVGLKVQTNEPTDVTATSFTANWQPLGHATEYAVSLSRVMTAKEDMQDVTVLEEDFENITEGTVENPGTDWISPFDFGAKGWASTAWCATQPAWAKGMAGTTGTNIWMGQAGLVYTPALDLSFYDGKGITIDATFVTTVAAFDNEGSQENEGVFAMLLNPGDMNTPLAWALLETPAVGSHSGKMVIDNIAEGTDLSNVVIAFMNKSGLSFFVDYAKISMNVPAGKSMATPYRSVMTNETSYKFDNLTEGFDYSFTVKASTSHNYYGFESDASDPVLVKTSTVTAIDQVNGSSDQTFVYTAPGQIITKADARVATRIFTPDGKLIANGKGNCTLRVAPGVYIVRTGTQTAKVVVR